MKHKLQTMLKHNWRTLLLLLTLVTTSQGVWGGFNVYLKQSGGFPSGDAYIYYWGGSSPIWPGTKMNTTTLLGTTWYYAEVADNTTGIIFNKGQDKTQTVDITRNDDLFFSVGTGTDGNGKYNSITHEHPYYFVAGNGGDDSNDSWCCDANWDTKACMMTGSSTLSRTFSNVASGIYKFKITKCNSWDSPIGITANTESKSTGVTVSSDDDGNIKFTTNATSNITVKYDGSDAWVEVEYPCAIVCDKTIPSFSTLMAGESDYKDFVFKYGTGITPTTADISVAGEFFSKTSASASNGEITVRVTYHPTETSGNSTHSATISIPYTGALGSPYTKNISATAKTYYIRGTIGGTDWDPGKAMTSTDGTTYTYTFSNLSASNNYAFKIFDGSKTGDPAWAGANSATVDRAHPSVTVTYNDGDDITFKADVAGNYTFSYNSGTNVVTVTYPDCTPVAPTVTTPTYSELTSTSVKLGGNVTNKGKTTACGTATLSTRGVHVYSNSTCTTEISGSPFTVTTTGATGIGTFTATIANLEPNNQYWFKAYATNTNSTNNTGITAAGTFTTKKVFTNVSVDDEAVCVGAKVTLTKASTPSGDGVSWTFSSGDTNKATVNSDGEVTGVSSGDVTITATVSKDGYDSYETTCTVTVNANPAAPSITSYDESVCSGGAPKFTFASTSGLTYQMYVGSSTSGNSVDGDGFPKTLTAGTITDVTTFNLRATNANECYASSSSADVSITPNMALSSISFSPSSICVRGESTIETDGLELGGGGVAYTVYADASSAISSISGTTITASSNSGTATIRATVSGGCGDEVYASNDITVVPAPTSSYTISSESSTVCSGGATITLSGSQSGYDYQLLKDGDPYLDPVQGDGSAIDFDDVKLSGHFTVQGYYPPNMCPTMMSGGLDLSVSLDPTLMPSSVTVKNYEPVTITSINVDISTWEVKVGGVKYTGDKAYLFDSSKTSVTFKGAGMYGTTTYKVKALTRGGCSTESTITVEDDDNLCN